MQLAHTRNYRLFVVAVIAKMECWIFFSKPKYIHSLTKSQHSIVQKHDNSDIFFRFPTPLQGVIDVKVNKNETDAPW